MEKQIFIFIALIYSVDINSQLATWIVPRSMVSSSGTVNPPTSDFLKFYEMDMTNPQYSIKERNLGNSVKSIISRGVNEVINVGLYQNGDVCFYAFANPEDGYLGNSFDDIYFIAKDTSTGLDEVFFKIEANGNGAGSVKNIEIIRDDVEKNNFHVFYKNSSRNNNHPNEISYLKIDGLKKTILESKLIDSDNCNEGMVISSKSCNNERYFIYTKSINNFLEIYCLKISGGTISPSMKLFQSNLMLNNNGMGQGDLEISPNGKLLVFANFTLTSTQHDAILYDLNLNEMKISNERFINNNLGPLFIASFSPDSKRLFLGMAGSSEIGVALFNVSVPISNYDIKNDDRVMINSLKGLSSMELTHQKELFIGNGNYLNQHHIIDNPNNPAETNNYITKAMFSINSNIGISGSFPDQILETYTVPFPKSIDLSKDLPCANTTIMASVPNNNNFSYEWKVNGQTIGNSNAVSFEIQKNETLLLTIINESGCDTTLQKNINVATFETAEFLHEVVPCSNGTVHIFPVTDTGVYVVRATDGSITGTYSETTFQLKPGEYQIEHIVNEGTPCASVFIQLIKILEEVAIPNVHINGINHKVCKGDTLHLSVDLGSAFEVQWLINNLPISETKQVSVLLTENSTIELIIKAFGCEKKLIDSVEVVDKVAATFDVKIVPCKNQIKLNFQFDGGVCELYNPNGEFITSFQQDSFALQPGQYSIKYYLNKGTICESTDSTEFQIPEDALPPFEILSTKDSLCIGEETILSSTPLLSTFQYSWEDQNNNPLGNGMTLLLKPSGNLLVSLEITNAFGCKSRHTKPVIAANPEDASFEAVFDQCQNQVKIESKNPGGTIEIINHMTNELTRTQALNLNLSTGQYNITYLLNENGICESRHSIDFVIDSIDTPGIPILANIFSPESVGSNQFFCMKNESVIASENFDMKIYDRWGNLVFKTNQSQDCWDGKINNEKCVPGVYAYILTYSNILCQNKSNTITGDVTLLR